MNEMMKKSFFAVAAVIAIGLFLLLTREDGGAELHEVNDTQVKEDLPAAESDAAPEMEVIVDVKGEVGKPGVYEMPSDARVHEVIEEAGGFTNEADGSQVNLAQRLQDEMIIIVPKTGEEGGAATGISEPGNEGKVRINIADQAEIETLNGIGPSKAEAIIQYREENGQFQTVEDLLDISGIGEKTLDNFVDDIIVP
jgi:competence protein ComEA